MLGNLVTAGLTAENATRAMVTSALLHPDSMFRTTPLAGDAARARRLAEHLSYALWDAPPDAELAAVGSGTAGDLGTRLRSQAERLGRDPRAVPVLARFMAQWLHVDLDLKLGADAAYATSPLYLELLAFVQDALATGVPVTSFVNGTRGFVHRNNLAPYGLTSAPGTADVAAVTWPATSPRRGVIGEEAIVDPTRHPDVGRRAIFRGLLVRSSLLCQTVPPPSAELVALAGEVTDRTKDARCSGCHLMLEPVGAAFAALDRDFTGTVPAVELNSHAELAGTYPQLAGFLDAVAASRAFSDCFARQMWAFFLEQPPAEVDAASIAELADDRPVGGQPRRCGEPDGGQPGGAFADRRAVVPGAMKMKMKKEQHDDGSSHFTADPGQGPAGEPRGPQHLDAVLGPTHQTGGRADGVATAPAGLVRAGRAGHGVVLAGAGRRADHPFATEPTISAAPRSTPPFRPRTCPRSCCSRSPATPPGR